MIRHKSCSRASVTQEPRPDCFALLRQTMGKSQRCSVPWCPFGPYAVDRGSCTPRSSGVRRQWTGDRARPGCFPSPGETETYCNVQGLGGWEKFQTQADQLRWSALVASPWCLDPKWHPGPQLTVVTSHNKLYYPTMWHQTREHSLSRGPPPSPPPPPP